MQPHLYKNIVLTGGNTLFPGFRDRVYKEVRALAPVEYQVSVHLPPKYARENYVNINICVYGNYHWLDIWFLYSALFAIRGKEASCWQRTLTLKRWWSHGKIMRKMDIIYARKSLIFNLRKIDPCRHRRNGINTCHSNQCHAQTSSQDIWFLNLTTLYFSFI